MSKRDLRIEELADEIILPRLKDAPGTAWTVGSMLTMVNDELPEGLEDPTIQEVEEALEYLQEGGAALELAGKGWVAL